MIRKTLIRSLVAVGAAAALVVLGGGTANAAVVDPSHTGITLDTNLTFYNNTPNGDWLVITADGTFTSSFIENTTLALQVVGTQTWTDANGTQTAPLDCSPVSIEFASTNHVECDISLQPNAIVNVDYTAEDAGAAPSPFTGSCFGTGVQLSSTNHLKDKDC